MNRPLLKIILLIFILFSCGVGFVLARMSRNLPEVIRPEAYKPHQVSEVFAEGGEKIGEFFELRRKPIPITIIPKVVIQAFIAAEDSHFYSHKGIDLRGIIRAAIVNMRNKWKSVQGGSTITQQVARNLLLQSREKKFSRKIKEILLSLRLEKELSKDEILYLYLNDIYLGHGAYGVQAAAQNYFGKEITELNLAEAAILAGLPQAPTRYSPLVNIEAAKERQIYVLSRMTEDGYISKREAIEAREQVLHFLQKHDYNLRFAPYFVEYLRQGLLEKYGFEKLYREGLKIYTTLNLNYQKAANVSVETGLRGMDQRQGYRGPLKHLSGNQIETFLKEQQIPEPLEVGVIYEAVVSHLDDAKKEIWVSFGKHTGEIMFEEMRWARKPDPDVYYMEKLLSKPSEALSVGDVIQVQLIQLKEPKLHVALMQEPLIQGGLLSFDHATGFVKAMVGGYDFSKSEFNRTLQSKRQVGSAFKPVIYAAALERGYTPASVIVDSPIIYKEGESEVVEQWKPRNFAEKFYGDTTLANALTFSRNIVTIKIAQDISVPYIIEVARRLGITSPLIEDLSMALGSSSLTLEEMCKVFAVFAREGEPLEPIYITKIVDRDNNILEEYKPAEKKGVPVLSPQLSYLMTDLLKKVILYGTGKAASDLEWPLAGKTGTTSDYADAWFIGYSPDVLTGVWVGFDERRKMGESETGAKAALPIWKDYMKAVLPNYKKRDFPVPSGIVFVNVDGKTGKLASKETKVTLSQPFVQGTEPKDDPTEKKRRRLRDEEQFFKEEM